MRRPHTDHPEVTTDEGGNQRTENHLYMNGPEIFNFTLRIVPATVESLLAKSSLALADVDLFVFLRLNLDVRIRDLFRHLAERL